MKESVLKVPMTPIGLILIGDRIDLGAVGRELAMPDSVNGAAKGEFVAAKVLCVGTGVTTMDGKKYTSDVEVGDIVFLPKDAAQRFTLPFRNFMLRYKTYTAEEIDNMLIIPEDRVLVKFSEAPPSA